MKAIDLLVAVGVAAAIFGGIGILVYGLELSLGPENPTLNTGFQVVIGLAMIPVGMLVTYSPFKLLSWRTKKNIPL